MKQIVRFLQIDKLVVLLLISAMIFNMVKIKYWNEPREILYWDVISYYGYLPATFIYKDLTLEFKDDYEGEHHFVIWANTAENGNYVFKTSMGLSYLYLPWFFVGHAIALNTDYDAGGYSLPYKVAMQFGVLVYLLIGLVFLRKVLRRYFSPLITALSMVSVVVGTNLYYYIVFKGTVSHSYNFVLFSIFLWIVIQWYEKKNLKYTLLLGLLTGLITLVRPTNIIVLILFVLWDVRSFKNIGERFRFFIKQYRKILLMILMFLFVWIPQLIYWKVITGDFFFYSYGDEGFFFLNPKIWKSLFSYRSGWLVYSPVMIFALIGIPYLLRNKTKELYLPVLVFTIINMWIIFSWWCWWWGGSFGLRPLTDSYAFLAIPLAAFIHYIFKREKTWLTIVFLTFLLAFNYYGVHMTRKYYNHSIHFDGMNKDLFWYNFSSIKPMPKFWSMIERPNYDNAKLGLDERLPSSLKVKPNGLGSYLSSGNVVKVLPFDPINRRFTFSVICGDTYYSNFNNVFIRNSDSEFSLDTLHAFSGIMEKTNLIVNLDAGRMVSNIEYELSFWYLNSGNRMDAYFYVNQIDADGNQSWTNYHSVEKWSESYGNWSLVKSHFVKNENTDKIEISFFYEKNYDEIVYYDNILVRPLNTDVLRQNSDGEITFNNKLLE